MLTKLIRGHECTDRPGVAELLGRSIQTVFNLAADRAATGFPEPWHTDTTGRGVRTRPDGSKTGREWYRITDITAFKPGYLARAAAAGQARSHDMQLDVEPDALLDPAAFAKLLRITRGTFSRYVDNSKPTWHAYAVAARHATLDGHHLIARAIADHGRWLIVDGPEEFELGPDIHTVFARYSGTWQPSLPGYTFTMPARDALTTLLAGDDFYLPPPDDRQTGKGGIRRRWLGASAATFIQHRRGSTSQPRQLRPAAPPPQP
ncbi:hypothetical protein ACQP2P_15875 [Dactylosporangium sp. CA-139114]|uniref:hypothetical protein n=1 Tax=Dactylosporangium sp. CA-139114 TaxID=3239931 RepID=UPI003D961389